MNEAASGIEVRALEAAQVPAYRALMLAAYDEHPDAYGSTSRERGALPLSWWEARIDERRGAVLGAFDGDDLVGVLGVSFESGDKLCHKAFVYGMYVAPRHRGRGLGRALVAAALETARRRAGIRVVQMAVVETNAAARRLYGESGFRAYGVEPMALRVGQRYLSKVHLWLELQDGSAESAG